jgi:hypothetical protein
MKSGDVYCFIDFEFEDGSKKDKLLIILNTPKDDEPFLLCLTTSQQKKWRNNQPGCHSQENYYFIDSEQDKFDKDTWIVFEKLYPFKVDKLLNSCLKDGTRALFELNINILKALKKCISKSNDIEQDYLEMILRDDV